MTTHKYDQELFTEYPLKGIPRTLWENVREASRVKGIPMRIFILQAMEEKLEREKPVNAEG